MDIESYERTQDALDPVKLIAQSEDDLRKGSGFRKRRWKRNSRRGSVIEAPAGSMGSSRVLLDLIEIVEFIQP